MKKLFKIFPYFLLFTFYFSLVSAQQHKVDSLYKLLQTENTDTGRLAKLNGISELLWRGGTYDSAMSLAKQSRALAEKLQNSSDSLVAKSAKKSLAQAYRIMGIIYRHLGNLPKALDYDFKALTINRKIGNIAGTMANLNNIGVVYWNMEDYDKALENYMEALKLAELTGDENKAADNIGNIGILYREKKDFAKALEYDLKALDIMQRKNDKHGVITNLGNIGIIYLYEKQYNKAKDYTARALALAEKINDKPGKAINLQGMGDVYKAEGNYTVARKYYDSSMAIARSIGEKNQIKLLYINYVNLDSLTGNYKAEAEDLKIAYAYRDSLVNEENTKKAVESEMNYNFEQKQLAEQAEQDKKDALAKAEEKKQTIIIASVSLGLLLVLVFSALLFSRFRITQKQKALIEEQNKDILDSIHYAKRIQRALFKEEEYITTHLPEHFIYFKPRDIVSGDFYWGYERDGYWYVAAVDCTGHGVPGAFLTMLGSAFLNEICSAPDILASHEILDRLRDKVVHELSGHGEVKDGMDISLCRIHLQTKTVDWAGAFNPLWYIPSTNIEGKGEVVEITADKQPIGISDNPKPFTTHSLSLSGSTLYLFTDGYADQFGGPKGKKFKYKQLKDKLSEISSKPMHEQKKILAETFESWKGSLDQVDDILIIGIRV